MAAREQLEKAQAIRTADMATAKGINSLNENLSAGRAMYQTQRNQVDADESKALDNQVLYAEARGDRGGIGQSQYGSIQNAASISATCKKRRSTPEYRAELSARVKDYYAHAGISPHRPAIPVKCIETGEVYSSMTKAEQATGIDHRSISYVCNGLKYSAGGLHWRFA